MDFIKRLNYLMNTPQYKVKKWNALMYLTHYENLIGRAFTKDDLAKLCSACHVTKNQYECVIAGSPLVSTKLDDRVIKYLKNLYETTKKQLS